MAVVDNRKVAVARKENIAGYPAVPPFPPQEEYPETAGRVKPGSEPNPVYGLVRDLFVELGLDLENFSTPSWNPLGCIIKPGHTVLLKPNLVRHIHMSDGDYNAVVTNGSVIRCLLDYVALALKGTGKVVVGDAPVQSADFATLVKRTGLDVVCRDASETWKIPIQLLDFRLWAVEIDERHCLVGTEARKGDPGGYLSVDLGKDSLLTPLNDSCEKFRVTSYDCREMIKHHNHEIHEYLVPKTVLEADVVINLPKLKTHRKVGLTASLKNLVGINGHKDWLPHHRCGSVKEGGDEYLHPSIIKKIKGQTGEFIFENPKSVFTPMLRLGFKVLDRIAPLICQDRFEEGSWHGNDTIWRTVLDLNRLLLYADINGRMTATTQRKILTIVDAIIAGDGEGPMMPDAMPCGLLAGGFNPLAVDTVLATVAGFDYHKIPLIARGYNINKWPLAGFEPDEITISSQDGLFQKMIPGRSFTAFCFRPPAGWQGHLEFPECLCKQRPVKQMRREGNHCCSQNG